MSKEDQVNEIREMITPWLELDLQEFLDREPWGELDFGGLSEVFQNQILPVSEYLKNLPIEQLSSNIIDQFKTLVARLKEHLDELDKFSVKVEDATNTHQNITNSVTGSAKQFFDFATTQLPFLMLRTRPGGEAERDLEKLQKEFAENVKTAKSTMAEVKDLLAGVRVATAKAGVEGFTEFFATEANSRAKTSYWWLTFSGLFAVIAVLVALSLYFGWQSLPAVDLNAAERSGLFAYIQAFAGRFILLGILVTAALWCGRQFNIQQNLRAINQHRSDSLKSFGAFTESAQTKHGQDKVLDEATKAIFRPLPTGHIAPSVQNSEASTNVIEIVERTTGAIKPSSN